MTYEIKPVLSNLNFRKLMKTCLWECIPILVRLFWTLIYFEVMNPTWIWCLLPPKRVCLWFVLDLSAILRNLHRNLALFQEWSVLNLNQICLLAGKSSKYLKSYSKDVQLKHFPSSESCKFLRISRENPAPNLLEIW